MTDDEAVDLAVTLIESGMPVPLAVATVAELGVNVTTVTLGSDNRGGTLYS